VIEDSPQVRIEGPICHLVLNNPERLNALAPAQHEGLILALRAAEADPAIRVIVLSGEGRAYCAGDNIAGTGGNYFPPRLSHRRVALNIGTGPLLLNEATSAFRNCLKPTIVLMHGFALGAGYDYASSCDFRLATRGCRIGDPRINLALWGAEGWSYKLSRLIGQTWVAPMTFNGELISGARAAEIGFVHKLYPDEAAPLREAANDFILRIASLDAETYRRTKSDILRGLDQTYEDATFAY
jgi:enoyl-CoA hydratase/carnithine racemase